MVAKDLCQKEDRSPRLHGELLGCLPSEVRVASAEMAVGGGLLQDRSSEVQISDDSSRSQVEVLLHDLNELEVGLAGSLAGAIRIDMNREGV